MQITLLFNGLNLFCVCEKFRAIKQLKSKIQPKLKLLAIKNLKLFKQYPYSAQYNYIRKMYVDLISIFITGNGFFFTNFNFSVSHLFALFSSFFLLLVKKKTQKTYT